MNVLINDESRYKKPMLNNVKINKTLEFVKSRLSGEATGHDFFHTYRVWKTAQSIALEEGADMFVVQMAALLHDIADWKFHNGDDSVGPRIAEEWLREIDVNEETIAHVCDIIRHISFKGAGVKSGINTTEGMIVQDADRLDALGAVGIARAFAYGGSRGREIYNPDEKPVLHESFEQYKNNKGTTVNHFYEKLLLLKGLMNTETAKKMAEERHKYMEDFLKQFYKEWEGRV